MYKVKIQVPDNQHLCKFPTSLLLDFFIGLCVYVYMVYACVCVHGVWMCEGACGGPKLMSGVHLDCSSLSLLRQFLH